jgi:hypothetical protein
VVSGGGGGDCWARQTAGANRTSQCKRIIGKYPRRWLSVSAACSG